MESEPFWDLFCITGEPLAYLLYRSIEAGRWGRDFSE
jgi:hypothetical protein